MDFEKRGIMSMVEITGDIPYLQNFSRYFAYIMCLQEILVRGAIRYRIP